ncbi:MAG TPA: acetolactate synthase [Clostridiaceae bacterium]|nr:acetolactate synthase [Clostridiaceae bacterium]
MMVKQVSVFLENKSGRLAEVSRILGRNSIDIRALSIADTAEFGILRLIVNNPDLAVKVLSDKGFSVGTTEVIAIRVDDKPGGLSEALNCLEENNIGIEYMYAFIGNVGSSKALVIIRVDDVQNALEILDKNNIETVPAEQIYSM